MWLSLRWPAHEGRRSTSQEMSSFSLFFILLFFTSHIVHVCFCCSHLFSCLSGSYFPSLSSPFSLFFMSPISPRQYPFPSLLPFFLAEEAQCLCIKVRTGGGSQPAREENKVTADKWKKLINALPALLIAIHHVLSLFVCSAKLRL